MTPLDWDVTGLDEPPEIAEWEDSSLFLSDPVGSEGEACAVIIPGPTKYWSTSPIQFDPDQPVGTGHPNMSAPLAQYGSEPPNLWVAYDDGGGGGSQVYEYFPDGDGGIAEDKFWSDGDSCA